MSRTRTHSWIDPATIGALAQGKSGLELLRALDPDHSAPIAETLAFKLAEVESGRVVFEIVPQEFHFNPMGTVHGGVAATLCDSAMGASVHSKLAAGQSYATLEMKVNLTRPITATTGLLRCEGTVITMGSRVAVAEAYLRDGAGRVYAHATSTCLISG